MSKHITQKEKILLYLHSGNTLTRLKALRLGFGIELPSRIWELKQAGFKIKTTWKRVKNGVDVAVYSLENRKAA
ncbi:MAG: hypothetical protein EHM58_04430 [Ignavibacteriae bacterium]|nr:MAG: hypothetical protein EHM58_04430 [Ignavibacteriota bacterium]